MSACAAGLGNAEKIDVLIVTAVELEYEEALRVETGAWPRSTWEKHPGPSGFEIAFRTFRAKDGSPMRFALTRAHGMGGVEAVNVALPAITAYQPRCLAMCGVCAGRREDVELGDVIVADRLWDYDTGKLKAEIDEAGNRTERIQGDMWQYLLDPVWKVKAERFVPEEAGSWLSTRPRSYEAQGDWVLERLADGEDPTKHPDRKVRCADQRKVFEQLWKAKLIEDGTLTLTETGRKHIGRLRILHSDGLPEAPAFKVRVGPIASGGRVVQDPQIFERLASGMRKVLGLEMEASAIGAIGHLQNIKAIVMKAVMDFADPTKADNFKAFAARAAAECLIAFLRANLEPADPGFDDILETGISPQPKNPSPAQMLNARYRFVPFYEPGRAGIMAELRAWCCETEASASARLVYASGGVGKTRLMSELCERLREQGWTAGFLAKYAPEQRFRDLAKSHRPTLVVIDYAESRAILAPLMSIAAQEHTSGSERRLRVILLARGTGDWWDELRKDTQVRDLFNDRSITQLIPLAPMLGGREEVFRSAAESFAILRGREARVTVPTLEDIRFDRALYVHMAALASVEGQPFTADSLMNETLDHEERFWLVQAHPSVVAGRAQNMFRTRARRASAAFTLIGGMRTREQAKDLIVRMEGGVDEEMLSLLRDLYPGAAQGTGQSSYVGSLEPDLLGEAMVFRTLNGEDDEADAMLRYVFQGCDEDAVEHGLAVLARVSINHREEASVWIERMLKRDIAGRALAALKAARAVSKESAHAALGMVLAKVLEMEGTKDVAEKLQEAGIPDDTVSLREVAVWVTTILLRNILPVDDLATLRERGRLWSNLGVRQSALGQCESALASTQEAVSIYRLLVSTHPNIFLPNLAASLNNLGTKQDELGQPEAALASMQEAVAIRCELAAARPSTFLPDLAMSLKNLGVMQIALGQREPALNSTQAAVALYRRLAAARPDAFLTDLATSLNNLGTMQGELGQLDSALASMNEAVAIYRPVAIKHPDMFLNKLAISLDNLGIAQSALGQNEAALASTEEAVASYRLLVAARPKIFLPDLAGMISNLGNRQSALGQRELALASAQEAVVLYRSLATALPNAFLSKFAISLNNLGARYNALGQREDALAAMQEAVSLRRALAAVRPDAFMPDLAISLNNLSIMQSKLGYHEAALTSAQEALDIIWPIWEANSKDFHSKTGIVIRNVFMCSHHLSRVSTPDLIARFEAFQSLVPK